MLQEMCKSKNITMLTRQQDLRASPLPGELLTAFHIVFFSAPKRTAKCLRRVFSYFRQHVRVFSF